MSDHLSRRLLRPRGAGLVVAAVLLLSGCAREASVQGEVTYDGTPVAKGTITFLPADGKGVAAAAPITDGKYTVRPIDPGPKLAQIEATRAVKFARSSEEMAKMAAQAKTRGNTSGLIDPADVIPRDALGNNAAVTIAAGRQTHDFHLKKPAKKSH